MHTRSLSSRFLLFPLWLTDAGSNACFPHRWALLQRARSAKGWMEGQAPFED